MRAARAFPDLTNTLDSELIDGSHGVFASNWNDAKQAPKRTGEYLVVVDDYQPVIALYVKGLGWDVSDSRHTGLDHRVNWWMEIPRGPR